MLIHTQLYDIPQYLQCLFGAIGIMILMYVVNLREKAVRGIQFH